MSVTEVADSNKVFKDTVFMQKNSEVSDQWVSIKELYPKGASQPLLPDKLSRDQFGQGNHYECFMLSALATLVKFPDAIRNCFVTKKVRQDGRYTFQFFRGTKWEKVEVDDMIPLEDDDVLYCQSPTEHWWPLLLEKAYAKFYTGYDQLEGCTMQEAFHDLTGFPVLNIPMQAKLAKTAGVNIEDGQYWIGLGQQVRKGEFLASILTKDLEQLESIGIQSEQQYGILDIFSLTGSAATSDIVIHLHNPFEDEEYEYSGPLNKEDGTWTAKQRAQYPVDDRHSIFMPLQNFIKYTNSMQLCFLTTMEMNPTSFRDQWSGPTAGGNPTFCTWRKNPLYLIHNNGTKDVRLVVTICQEDQRRFTDPDEATKYIQCGVVLVRYTYPNPIPTFWVTGNNHKPAFKSLFLNSREVSNTLAVPPQSLCYLVPSTMNVGSEAPFDLVLHQFKNEDYSNFSISKLAIPDYDWEDPAKTDVQLAERSKDRVDFYVDMETDIHILLHQTKPFVGKTGGDAMTEDYMGMYLYDDTDRRIGGVHAATNFREISVIHHLPRSGRYAISLTCPRAKGDVPAYVTVVGCNGAHARIVETPEDATMFDDEDDIDEGDDAEVDAVIDYVPIHLPVSEVAESPDSDTPFEDKRFYNANRGITADPWVHIGDLYPEGKKKPLLPDTLSRDQFTQGEHYECCALSAFAAALERHPDVLRNCFVTKKPRKDGRYTFQFHRYGQWVKVEIDDRIPQVDGNTLYCRSPTHHWWPLLLEKAYAKFYTLYDNLEGITQEEVLHDFSGRPVVSTSTEPAAAEASCCYFDEGPFWRDLKDLLANTVVTAQAGGETSEGMGLQEDQYYSVLDIIPTTSDEDSPADTIYLKMYNPFEEAPYTGPMNKNDAALWTPQLRSMLNPDERNIFYIPASEFAGAFKSIQQAYTGGIVEPGWHFNSEWTDETNGGNPSLISWRTNPVYVLKNASPEPVQIVAMVRQPDQRHILHTLPEQHLAYPQKGLTLAQAHPRCSDIPTYLVTMDNHKMVHKGLFFSTREVSNVMTLPPSSLSYLVGSCMYHDKTKYMLSYWFFDPKTTADVDVRRFRSEVAREMPAVENVVLENRGKERVDFLVDAPTNVHILVRQDKTFHSAQGGDVMAQDFIGAYLYDDENTLLKGSQSATCYREVSVVHTLPKAGHYVLALTCPRAQGQCPCHVEIVASEQAHVRITDPPENPEELADVDLGFLDPMPEGIPLSDLPLHSDPTFQSMLDDLRALAKNPSAKASDVEALRQAMNARAHELAKQLIGQDRPQYLQDLDLEALNPVLDDHEEYMSEELKRHNLKADPRNHYKVKQQEEKLRSLATQIADEELNNVNLDFLDQLPEGIPLDDVRVMEDAGFTDKLDAHKKMCRNRSVEPTAITTGEDDLNSHVHDLARAMHDKERFYLDPEPEGVPLVCLPLNTDAEFNKMENKLRAMNNDGKTPQSAIKDLQDKLNDRAHELATDHKEKERDMFLKNEYAGVPRELLPIDSDPKFNADEVARLRARAEDPVANAAKIKDLEDRMNARALELAGQQKLNDRAFLDGIDFGVPPETLNQLLDSDPAFLANEAKLRELKKDPRRNAKAIADLEAEMAKQARKLTEDYLAGERTKYLKDEYEGRPTATLPLSDDAAFRELENEYLAYREDPHADPARLKKLQEQMDQRATEIARDLNRKDRSKYLGDPIRGVPLSAIPLDDDDVFTKLERSRARALNDPNGAANAADLEKQLKARADELARDQLSRDRNYLNPTQSGIPVELVPVDADKAFADMEAERAELKQNAARNAKAIEAKEEALNDRAAELADNLKQKERDMFMDDEYAGVPRAVLPLDTDSKFHDDEVARLRARAEDPVANAAKIKDLEDRMNARALELAGQQKLNDRAFLDGIDFGVPPETLNQLLDSDPAFLANEAKLRELKKDPRRNAKAIADLEAEMAKQARKLTEDYLAGERAKYLKDEYEGRPTATLPLSDDAAFRELENEYLAYREDPHADPARLKKLQEQMDQRATEIARDLNRKDRSKYLGDPIRGVPLSAIPLDDDDVFTKLERSRARALNDPNGAANAADLEKQLKARADELARDQLSRDRNYLNPTQSGIPVELVPVDTDKTFADMEAERAELKQNAARNAKAIEAKEIALNDRAAELADNLKQKERDMFLKNEYAGVPRELLPIDSDPKFNADEVARLRARAEDPVANAAKIKDLEDRMNARALELAGQQKLNDRAFLDGIDFGVPPETLNQLLDSDPAFLANEAKLRELKKDPRRNAKAIADLEAEMAKQARKLTEDYLAGERTKYLKDEYEGRPTATLPLSDDAAFRELENEYLAYREDPHADPARLKKLQEQMDQRATEIAHALNVADRPAYLGAKRRGIPLTALPLDTDPQFRAAEMDRARAVTAQAAPSAVAPLEDALRKRADEIAAEQLSRDRDYLDPAPEGIPLECLALSTDPAFTDNEEQRASLVAQNNPSKNQNAIAALQDSMNGQAHQLAKALKADHIAACVDPVIRGVPRELLPIADDKEATALIAARAKALKAGDTAQAKSLGAKLNARAHALADAAIAQIRANLEQAPLQVPVEELNLDADPKFKQLEVEAIELQSNPQKNKAALDALYDDMDKRARELAEEKLWKEREANLDNAPEGRRLRELPLNDDDKFMALEKQRHDLLKAGNADPAAIAKLNAAMNERAHQIAHKLNADERGQYIDRNMRGVPLEALGLSDDDEFVVLEQKRAAAKCADPTSSDAQNLEEQLRSRAANLAERLVSGDRAYLDKRPEGVPLRQIAIDEDPTFKQLEERRAQAKVAKDAGKMKEAEAALNNRAHEMAQDMKDKLRAKLEQNHLGVPLADLPLDDDKTFNDLEEAYRDAEASGDAAQKRDLLDKLNARATELAAQLHKQERAGLNQAPEGIPLSALPVNEDPTFNALEKEARALRKTPNGPEKNAARLAQIEDALNARAEELANKERAKYLDAEPEGIPLASLHLAKNPAFLAKEAERRRLLDDAQADPSEVKDAEKALNAMAHALARDLVQGDRSYLDPNPEGVALSVLPLDTDAKFHEMELARARLRAEDPRSNAAKIKAYEDKLNERAHELALAQKKADLEGLDPTPEGVPLELLKPHEDSLFAGLVDEVRALKKDPSASAAAIADKQREMNDRAHALAARLVSNDRGYLDQAPEGVPVALLDLDGDRAFKDLETRRANLKAVDPARNAAAIKELEKQLNDRVHQMAKDRKAAELAGLDKSPCDIPLDVLDPYADADFMASVKQLRALDATDSSKDARVAPIKAAMNERCHAMAHKMLDGDRGYLQPNPLNVPLSLLPLDTDPEFHKAEVRRAVLKAENPQRNAEKIKELEDQLNVRARELAEARRRQDLAGLDEEPEGIPLAALDPHSDAAFAQMVDRRRALEKDPAANADTLTPLVAEMNARAHELARARLEGDRGYLDKNPEGVPLAILPLDTDAKFRQLEGQRAALKAQDPRRNAARIQELEGQLNERAHELAKAQKAEDLRGLNPAPRGVPIELLNPHDDPAFAEMVDSARALKSNASRAPDVMPRHVASMDDRVDALAKAVMDRAYLDPTPEGVPLAELDLDGDTPFTQLEAERATLKLKDPRRNEAKIKDVEDQLNDRAHELAKAQRETDLRSVDASPEGIPKALLKLHDDADGAALIAQLRANRKRDQPDQDELRKLEDALNARAHEIARQLRVGDRDKYLDPKPLGIPLDDLPLDTDTTFSTLELETAKLKAVDPRANASKIKSNENLLNDRAYELARVVMDEDLAPFAPSYEGIATRDLEPHKDTAFAEAAAKLRRQKRQPQVTWKDDLEQIMGDRLVELAKEKSKGDLYFLDPEPEGVPLEEVPILTDSDFDKMRQKREQLKSADALGNRDAILALEKKMNDRSHELARDILAKDLAAMDQNPLDIPLALLRPRQDDAIAQLIPELRRSRRLPALRGKAGELEKQMDDRGLALAQAALEEGRDQYLDQEPEGVPLGLLPLGTDPAFHKKEAERAVLRLKDPDANRDAIKALETQLNARAHELARQQLADDLKGIDQAPEGVPLSVLNPHHDAKMAPMIQQLRLLKNDPLRNADKIKRQEAEMNERAHEMARDLLKNDRGYLKPSPLGVPLSELPLDTDSKFHDLEVRRAVEKAHNPGSTAVKDLEAQLNARAEELAQAQLDEDLRGLNPAPLGVPLALLAPHADDRFAAQIPELRRLNHNPARNVAGIRAVQDKLNGRDMELAEAFLEKDRARYLDADVEGLPWSLLPLNDNVDFKAMENEKLALQAADPTANARKIEALETKLNAMAHEMAQQQLRKDRGYLDQNPEGVALAVLPLDTDPKFRSLEAARAAAKANRSTAEVRELEEKLNARAHELATAQKAEDLRGLDEAPRGVPIEALKPHDDPLFAQMVDELRELKQDPEKNRTLIADLQARMNDRAGVLADNVLSNDRGYLPTNPEGIPLRRLPLDTDPEFHAKEVARAMLKLDDPKKNQSKIRDLEDELSQRARELAKQVKENDLRDLDQAPRGIPLALLQPHKSAPFASALEEKSRLITSRSADGATQPAVQALNAQATELADKLLKGDRDYLDRDPEGVPLSELALDTDPEFHSMEVQRAILKLKDPVKNAAMVEDLEDQLNNRAHELAREMLAKDRDYLDPEPLGVELVYLPLNTDSKFHQLEMERRRLKSKDPKANAARIAELEQKLNERATELAKKQLEDDLIGLDREPEGYPLEFLQPHKDAEFAALLPALRESKARGDVAAVRKLQEQLNERTHALAKAKITEDRAFLDQKPEGVPLELLPINSDPEFHTAEKELRAYKAAPGTPDNKAMADAQRRMEARAHELARDHLQRNRGFLDPEPEGVPIEEVPLDNDAAFRALEVERLRLLPTKGSSKQVADLEARLNERAHELAKQVKDADRAFLRDASHDLPKPFINLDSAKAFTKPERELRRLRGKTDSASLNAAAELQREMQKVADDVAEKQIKGDREHYLDLQPEGVDIDDVPIDQDKAFHDLEIERAIKIAEDPVANKDEIKELEKRLNDRAHELAQQVIEGDREYLPAEIRGIPRDELPLNTDDTFRKLERKRRVHKRGLDWDAVLADEDLLNQRAGELAEDVIAQDLAPLRECYRNIPKQDLSLHDDEQFRALANKRRRQRGKGRVNPTEMAMIEDEMDRRACEIADDVIDNERGFLDQEPEGMYLKDVPLDDDPTFAQLEAEYRRRSKDPRAAKQNKQVLRELALEMNSRSHALARQEFDKARDFMDPEPEGIPLYELGLDEDPEFKDAEIARYRNARGGNPDATLQAQMAARMAKRAAELARVQLAADRAFLDPEPEGVPLSELPLDADQKFGDLARERRRQKKGLQKAMNEDKVRGLEDEMNTRAHEMAKDFLETERAFLEREPEGVPLADLPLNADAPFRAMERERLKVKREPSQNGAALNAVEGDLTDRARQIARDQLKKERAFLEQEPLGVPLEELPLNFDAVLNPIERRRRALRTDPKRNQEPIRSAEDQMADRVNDIAADFIAKERAFMDQEPEGVPLRYLPLGTDREFHEMERQRRALLRLPESNKPAIASLETRMNERAHVLARDLVEKGRAFLDSEPLGVPIADVPLNGDEEFRKLEEQRRAAKQDPRAASTTKALEDRLNERARDLAAEQLRQERAFMDQAPLGIPLDELPLNNDRRMREIERTRRHLRKEDPQKYAGDIAVLEEGMQTRAYELAQAELASDRGYLDPEPSGVPLADLPLDTDPAFHQQELERRELKKRGRNLQKVPALESTLDARVRELAADFIKRERAYLDQEPEGIPLERLPLDKDGPFHAMELERRQLLRNGQNPEWVKELERRLNDRAHQLALEIRGWQDKDFHEANRHVADQWPRICELYPDGRAAPLKPEAPSTADVMSAEEDIGYLAPFIAALGRHPVLLQRLMVTDAHPVNAPYTFIFFDPNSSPVYVDIDDRIPCTTQYEPKFTQTPNRMWYPLLLEKAYAKFVGGYEQLDNCTPHETLRDLTGRPVTHTPFDDKLADAANTGDFTAVDFWRGVAEDLGRGDVIMAMSNGDTREMNGIHPQCSYPVLAVIETVPGTRNAADVVIRLQNSYRLDAPFYDGPLSTDDVNWSDDLRQVCRYDASRDDIIHMPLPTFLRNFSSMQSCHINCGDRLTATGTWDRNTSGGNPKFTTFRNNPIFLVENKSSRAAAILAEVRHTSPMFVDPDGLNHYPQTGIALLQGVHTSLPPTPLITNSTHRFLQKGIMLDSREVCAVMEIPPNATCYVVPYTMKAGQTGSFNLSVYPGMAKVSLTPLHLAGLSREPTTTRVTLTPGDEGKRVDFTLSAACDVHILLHQDKTSDERAARKGDAIAEDDCIVTAFTEQGVRCGSSGEATNAREHSLVFKATQPGRYSLLLTAPNQPTTGNCPCTLSVYTPKRVTVKYVPPPAGARPLQQARFPTLPKAEQNARRRASSAAATTDRNGAASGRQGTTSLPPLNSRAAATSGRSPGSRY